MASSIKCVPMPEKSTISDIRVWFGLVNKLALFPITTEVMKPFRELLKTNSKHFFYIYVYLHNKITNMRTNKTFTKLH